MFPALEQRRVPSTQGQSASYNGKALENRVELFLKGYGYAKNTTRAPDSNTPYFISQYKEPGEFLTIYGKPQIIDFFIYHPAKYLRGLLFECKSQNVAGSVDMKLPYTVLSLKQAGIPAILLIEGAGPTPHALEWCRAQQNEQFMFFHGFNEFQQAAARGLF